MKTISRWGGMSGALGGLIWAVAFYVEATNPGFDLLDLVLNKSAFALTMVLGVALQAAGFYSLSDNSKGFSIPRISAAVCALGALGQSLAMAVSVFVWGGAWILGILGELVITIALGTFAVSSIAAKLPLMVKLLPFLMVPVYFIGWSVDPESWLTAGLDLVNLSAAAYGLLWIPFGYTVWDHSRAGSREA